MFVLNNTKELKPGKSWVDDNGLQHPSNWASVWSDDVKASYGIKEVSIQTKPDSKFYWVNGPHIDGTWTSKERSLEDVKEVDNDGKAILDADGNQVITPGLKSQWVNRIKEKANGLLAPTDWQVIAKAERDRAVDSDVATYRAAVITACTAIRKSITDITYPETPSNYAAARAKLEDDRTDAEKKIVSDHDAEVAAVFTSFKALFDTPVDSDGKPTGNAPMYDWPMMGE
tara:strand:+ start:965 stop:1651 length:687 start_codon:yes stop_codon:yes gene_type:complete